MTRIGIGLALVLLIASVEYGRVSGDDGHMAIPISKRENGLLDLSKDQLMELRQLIEVLTAAKEKREDSQMEMIDMKKHEEPELDEDTRKLPAKAKQPLLLEILKRKKLRIDKSKIKICESNMFLEGACVP